MRPTIMDMSRDECRKCLRCLELDAYGNMVSVLRAQGSLTEEKRKLLGQLAKILHISNERHRAEIRRAVNDEKLSIIAEQLNGSNVYTDWAIEGRRSIPLLPRLKARTAFTGLADSLSLVLAAANEKKFSIYNKTPDPLAKEGMGLEDSEKEDGPLVKLPQLPKLSKLPILRTEGKARGGKRKRTSPESLGNEKCQRLESAKRKTQDTEEIPRSRLENRVKSPLPPLGRESGQVVEVSIATTAATRIDKNNSPENSPSDVSNHQKYIVKPLNHRNSDQVDIEKTENGHVTETTSITNDINGRDSNIIDQCKISSMNSSLTVNSESTTSCAPGPPIAPSLAYKKMPTGELHHQNTGAKMGITLNSGKTLKINAHPNGSLANVIVVKKDSARGVTLSHGGKEILGKVIMRGKHLCLTSQINNASAMARLAHRGSDVCNNGQQTLTTFDANTNTEIPKMPSERGNDIVLDIRRDVPEGEKAVLPCENVDESTSVNADARISGLECFGKDDDLYESTINHLDCNFIKSDLVSNEPNSPGLINGSELIEENENCSNLPSIVGNADSNADSSDMTDNGEIVEMIDEGIIETSLDTRSEIYNCRSNDEIIIEEDAEESLEASNMEIFSTAFDPSAIHMDNFQYMNNGDRETVIEVCRDAIQSNQFRESIAEIDDL